MKALVILARGFEEIEAITVIDLLRRAGIETVVAGLEEGPITASRGTRHLADTRLADVAPEEIFEIVILPGGAEGAQNLAADVATGAWLKRQRERDGWIGAICAAPTALQAHGVLDPSRKIVAHPTVQDRFPAGQVVASRRVVVDGKLITGLAAGAAMEFGFEIVRQLLGEEAVARVNVGVVAILK